MKQQDKEIRRINIVNVLNSHLDQDRLYGIEMIEEIIIRYLGNEYIRGLRTILHKQAGIVQSGTGTSVWIRQKILR